MNAKIITEPLVTLDILEYYDSQIKRWVINRINHNIQTSILFFPDKDSLPEIGEMDTLYVTKNELFLWDQNNNSYIAISTQGGDVFETLQWGSF